MDVFRPSVSKDAGHVNVARKAVAERTHRFTKNPTKLLIGS